MAGDDGGLVGQDLKQTNMGLELQELRRRASDPESLDRLASLLDNHNCQHEPWPLMDFLRCYQAVWLALPESARDGSDAHRNQLLDRIHRCITQDMPSLPDLIPSDPLKPALVDTPSDKEISYAGVHRFIQEFDLRLPLPAQTRPRVAVMLPNGSALALACLAVANKYTLIPMAKTLAPEQVQADLEAAHADAILMLEADVTRFHVPSNVAVFAVHPEDDLTLSFTLIRPGNQTCNAPTKTADGSPGDPLAVLLFTSGTSGKKKLVPITVYNLIASAVFTMDSMGLDGTARCLNMMPLHHIGGIIRSLYASILAGGAILCCPTFDPNSFWDVVEQWSPTWYYATPTMHQMILGEAEHRVDAVAQSRIQFVFNAGGGLPPTLATQLREVFQCTILPSYGMTECSPVAAPPLNYALERTGASGRAVGPELAILDIDIGKPATRSPQGTTGRICVRGLPVFPGYLTPEGKLDRSAFDDAGWFDTGDLGYMDDEGYLFITGRSKEVINRGGEIISPLEVENAILAAARDPASILFRRVTEALVFSTPHEDLQEVVAAVIVTPRGQARPDLRQVHEALQDRLHPPQWPVILVYMEGGVPKSNNKLQRIRLSQRLGLQTLTDAIPVAERHYEAVCPAHGTPLTEPIHQTKCEVDGSQIHAHIAKLSGVSDVVVRCNPVDGFLRAIIFQNSSSSSSSTSSSSTSLTSDELVRDLRGLVDGYLIPSSIKILSGSIPRDAQGSIDETALDEAIRNLNPIALSPIEQKVRELFATALNQAVEDMTPSTDFFAGGGDSLSAGRLVSRLRQEFDIRLPGDILFRASTIGEITAIVETARAQRGKKVDLNDLPGCRKTYSSTNPIILLIHLIPILFFYPLRVASQWTLFLYIMSETAYRFPIGTTLAGRLFHIVLVGAAARLAMHIIAPTAAILFKWLLIGRYKAGMYPMWGPYHTRWWLTQKALQIGGKGIFDHFYWSRALYYRALGARIGRNVRIHESAALGECDLIQLDDNVVLDSCIVRPFAVERNTSMLLQPIHIGANSCIGLCTVIAPGASLAPGTRLGPNSSSWEAETAEKETTPSSLPSDNTPSLPWIWSLLVVEPLAFIVRAARRLPWFIGVIPIVLSYPGTGKDMLRVTVYWFTDPHRIGYHLLARIYYSVVGPIIWFTTVYLIKLLLTTLCGRPIPGPSHKISLRQRLRSAVLYRLLPGGNLAPITGLIGKHYELVSIAVRMLGGRVGKRVYWPSIGPGIQDFDLVDVGNDVVFGSRSHLVMGDEFGRDRVVISDGAMLGDRAVVLPGVTVGEQAMIGSGSLLRRNGFYPPHSVWVGSKNGEAVPFPSSSSSASTGSWVERSTSSRGGSGSGSESDTLNEKEGVVVVVAKETTIRPFGRAFYEGEANFYVIGIPGIVAYSTVITVVSTVWWLLSMLAGLLVLSRVLRMDLRAFDMCWWRPFAVYGLFCAVVSVVNFIQSIITAGVVVAAKWMVFGRRQEGSYHWHRSSYNQRWQFFLAVESLLKDSYRGIGLLPMLSGTAYLSLYYRAMGAKIGADCALLANGEPNIMPTEPDLLTLGDRVAVDDASLVSHLNSRGEFELHTLRVGDRSVLRTGTRLLSGASMGSDACLLEHTLVLSGDHVEDGSTLQGWPAEVFSGQRVG